jgi:hypothetical protein
MAPEPTPVIPDYDALTQGDLIARIRALNDKQLTSLLHYEQAHADRPQIVLAIRTRLDGLAAGATPSGGDPAAATPDAAPPADGGSPASPATAGPPQNPPSHGTPVNPRQPR